MRLSDAEIDRILHFCSKVEDLSNSRSVNEMHPVSDPAFRHLSFQDHKENQVGWVASMTFRTTKPFAANSGFLPLAEYPPIDVIRQELVMVPADFLRSYVTPEKRGTSPKLSCRS